MFSLSNEQPSASDPSRSTAEWNKQCSVCFMTFPSSMGSADRSQHMREHRTDT